jgi:hypothetical protein
MRKLTQIGIAFFSLTTSACAPLGTSMPIDFVPSPAETTQIQLKSGNGYHRSPVGNVTSVEVKLNDGPHSVGPVEEHFEGELAARVLVDLGLNAPKERGPSGGVITGYVTVHFSSGEERHLDILSDREVEDHDHFEVTYRPRKTLDLDWLQGFRAD